MHRGNMSHDLKTIVVVGASRGIGGAIAQYFNQRGHRVWSVSRSSAVAGRWVQADMAVVI